MNIYLKKEMRANPWGEMKLGFDALNGGFYISPSLGISIQIARDYAFFVAFAYGVNPTYEENNIGLRIGFQFWKWRKEIKSWMMSEYLLLMKQ